MYTINKKFRYYFCFAYFAAFCSELFADPQDTIGTLFTNVSGSFGSITNFMFAIAVIAGLCFAIAALFKFKQHKDNPQQTTIGQPIGLFFLGGVMLWLPFIIKSIGVTIVGSSNVQSGQSTINPGSNSGFNKYLIND